jgi:hypothetical protein
MTMSTGQASTTRWRWRRFAPAATLLLLAPLVGEVLSGATRLSFIAVLVPEIMVWGCGALIIREAVRRWGGGGTSMLLLGLALAIAEEFVIQQTSLAPMPWLPASIPAYGRVLGVNWVYFLFMLAYEAVWIVLVPVAITELIFSERRHELWLRTRGLIVAGVVFLVGSFIAWFLWVRLARPNVFHVPEYQPPLLTVLAGVVAIAALAGLAYGLRTVRSSTPRTAVSPWLVGATTLVFGFPWYVLMVVIFAPNRSLPLWVPMVAGTGWALLAFVVISRLASGRGWTDTHRWALVFGALLVNMLAGFLGASIWTSVDLVAKIVMNIVAVVLMLGLLWRLRHQPADVGSRGL